MGRVEIDYETKFFNFTTDIDRPLERYGRSGLVSPAEITRIFPLALISGYQISSKLILMHPGPHGVYVATIPLIRHRDDFVKPRGDEFSKFSVRAMPTEELFSYIVRSNRGEGVDVLMYPSDYYNFLVAPEGIEEGSYINSLLSEYPKTDQVNPHIQIRRSHITFDATSTKEKQGAPRLYVPFSFSIA